MKEHGLIPARMNYTAEGAEAGWVPIAIILRIYRTWLAGLRWVFASVFPDPFYVGN